MHLPLTQWTLEGENLPERLFDKPEGPAFSLPGADALSAFADLLGEEESSDAAQEKAGVPYIAGSFFESDLSGRITLSREIDFGAYQGDRALVTFAHIAGSGEICLDDVCIARFGEDRLADLRCAYDLTGMPCALCVDVTDALMLGRKQKLSLRFDESHPAGIVGAAFLSVTVGASLSRVSIQPDTLRKTMTIRARISAQRTGHYVLHIQEIPGTEGKEIPAARETDVELDAGMEKGVQLSMQVDASAFVPGQTYAAPALKIQLFERSKKKINGRLCDEALLMCGYGPSMPRAWLPLTQEDCLGDPEAVCSRLHDIGIYAVKLPACVPDGFYRALTRAGIAAVGHVSEEIRSLFTRYPCLALTDLPLYEEKLSLKAAAWQMAGSVAFPRIIDGTMTDDEMLAEVTGRMLDSDAQGVNEVLMWLRTVQIRLRAEAARQGRYEGALCNAQELDHGDICDALRTAFAGVHLSALPLSGAWWTGTHFSASLEAFIPENMLSGEKIYAHAVLEDEAGNALTSFTAPCRKGGYVGVVEAALPDHPCVLTLHCALCRGEETLEESMLPVYVGERGVLEAAF